jgi:hypothetical protein
MTLDIKKPGEEETIKQRQHQAAGKVVKKQNRRHGE